MTFTVGQVDYSDHVIAGTYDINNKPQYRTWEDGNCKTRRTKLRDQIVGSFNMFFRTESDYEDFLDDIEAAKDVTKDGAVSISITVNNTLEQADTYAYIDYNLVRNIDGAWQDYFEIFTVNIEEW